MVSFDVESLLTNVHIEAACSIAQQRKQTNKDRRSSSVRQEWCDKMPL